MSNGVGRGFNIKNPNGRYLKYDPFGLSIARL